MKLSMLVVSNNVQSAPERQMTDEVGDIGKFSVVNYLLLQLFSTKQRVNKKKENK